MNQYAAFLATVQLADARKMPALPGSSLGLDHLRDMLTRITAEFSDAKLGRWLGWAQCALVASDAGVTLEDMKQINMRYAGAEGETNECLCNPRFTPDNPDEPCICGGERR